MNRKLLILGGVGVVLVGLLVMSRVMESAPAPLWKDTTISCLVNGHQNLAQHIHQELSITKDGVAVPIPSNIGITQGCMAEVHTHEADGTIHVESIEPKTFTLQDFFAVYGQPLEQEGYALVARSNGEIVEDPASLVLVDHQTIELEYTSAE